MTNPEPAATELSDPALAAQIARDAGELLVSLRSEAASSPRQVGDRGDLQANVLIARRLAAERPDDAILSEETPDDRSRLVARRVWIVDPLDGTREYTMPGRDDWAVHVALWEAGSISAAAVAQPALGQVYATDTAAGYAEVGQRSRPLILVSESRPPAFAGAVASAIGADLAAMGSAGAKAMAVLRGDADVYLHAGGQWEWDSAAPVGVAVAAGLHASRIDGSALRYNQPHPYLPDLLICRSELAGAVLEAIRPELS